MGCEIQTLLTNATCFACLTPGQRDDVRLALLCRKVNGVTGQCDVATLLAEAACFSCLPSGQKVLAELAMLCQLVAL